MSLTARYISPIRSWFFPSTCLFFPSLFFVFRHASLGLSVSSHRSPSAMSTDSSSQANATAASASGVRMRHSAHPRRPRPISIATTGVMSTSMYEKRSAPMVGATASGATTPGSRPSSRGGDAHQKCEILKIKTSTNNSLSYDDIRSKFINI